MIPVFSIKIYYSEKLCVHLLIFRLIMEMKFRQSKIVQFNTFCFVNSNILMIIIAFVLIFYSCNNKSNKNKE